MLNKENSFIRDTEPTTAFHSLHASQKIWLKYMAK